MIDLVSIGRFAGALGLVLGLIALCAYAARRFDLVPAARGGRKLNRIGIVEVQAIDGKRRLVLVQRDGQEHLLLLGPSNDLLIETGIGVPATPRTSLIGSDPTVDTPR